MSTTIHSTDSYALPRHPQETRRLNAQNQFLLQIFGNHHIHPSISNTTNPNLKIADISCGSGIWLTEVANLFPKAECHGFDISPAQFPSSSDLEQRGLFERLHFHVRDAADSSGPGEEFVGEFDIVDVRLMHINLVGEQWDQAVRNAVAILKPGGWLQWQDWNCETARLALSKPGVKYQAMQEMLGGFLDFVKTRDTAATERIGEVMVRGGLEKVVRETYVPDFDLEARMKMNGELFGMVPKVIRGVLVGREGSGWDEERIASLEREVVEELESKAVFVRFDLWWYLGRKPI